jgi:two-component system LytT family response regulator
MSLEIFIADDETPARRKLARFLADHTDVSIVGEASNGIDALDLIAMTKPALVFLDVNMPDLDGIGVAETLARAERPPAIVFVTAFDQFAVKAFEVSAVDYLLKPYDRERFEHALARARRTLEAHVDSARIADLLATVRKEDRYLRRVLVPNEGRSFFVPIDDVVRLAADRNSVELYLKGGARHTLRATLEWLESKLDPARFARVHRSHIVNIDAIGEISSWFHGDYKIKLRDDTEITWSRRYVAKRPDLFA